MDVDKLIEQTREIIKTHYEGMESLCMGSSNPAILKKDLHEQLSVFLPDIDTHNLHPLYDALKDKGYATLITNDTITFSKSFIGK